MTNEELYKEVHKTAFITSRHISKNYHDAQDIAQEVCLKFFLRIDDTEKPIENPISWAKIVARNATYEKLKKQKKLSEIDNLEYISDPNQVDPSNVEEGLIEGIPDLEENDVKGYLNRDDFSSYKKYIKYKGKTGEYAKAHKLTYSAVATRIYRMKRNLKAAYLKDIGYIAGKDIIDFQTNNNIIKFVKIFADKMKQDDLKSLHKYFEKYSIDTIPNLEIEEYKIYEIKLVSERKFEMLYGYLDIENRISFVVMKFSLNRFNSIKITNVTFPLKITKIKSSIKVVNEVLPNPIKGEKPIKVDDAISIVTNHIERK